MAGLVPEEQSEDAGAKRTEESSRFREQAFRKL